MTTGHPLVSNAYVVSHYTAWFLWDELKHLLRQRNHQSPRSIGCKNGSVQARQARHSGCNLIQRFNNESQIESIESDTPNANAISRVTPSFTATTRIVLTPFIQLIQSVDQAWPYTSSHCFMSLVGGVVGRVKGGLNLHCTYFPPLSPWSPWSSTFSQKLSGKRPCSSALLAMEEQKTCVPPGYSLSPIFVWGSLHNKSVYLVVIRETGYSPGHH